MKPIFLTLLVALATCISCAPNYRTPLRRTMDGLIQCDSVVVSIATTAGGQLLADETNSRAISVKRISTGTNPIWCNPVAGGDPAVGSNAVEVQDGYNFPLSDTPAEIKCIADTSAETLVYGIFKEAC